MILHLTNVRICYSIRKDYQGALKAINIAIGLKPHRYNHYASSSVCEVSHGGIVAERSVILTKRFVVTPEMP